MAEFMQQDAKKQQHHEYDAIPCGCRAARYVTGGENPGQEKQECEVHADYGAGHPSNIKGPWHEKPRMVGAYECEVVSISTHCET